MVTRLSRARGFTLPELLAVVVITGVLAGVAAPSVSTLVANQRTRSAASELVQSLVRARSEAIRRNMEVTLRAEGAGWQTGWRILNPSDTGHPVEVHGPIPAATFTGPSSVAYEPSGRIRGTDSPAFDIVVEHADGHRCVLVDLSGRPYLKRDRC